MHGRNFKRKTGGFRGSSTATFASTPVDEDAVGARAPGCVGTRTIERRRLRGRWRVVARDGWVGLPKIREAGVRAQISYSVARDGVVGIDASWFIHHHLRQYHEEID